MLHEVKSNSFSGKGASNADGGGRMWDDDQFLILQSLNSGLISTRSELNSRIFYDGFASKNHRAG